MELIPWWTKWAKCLHYDPNLWFPEWPQPNTYKKARRICKTCPVLKQCRAYGLDINPEYGMFGGLTPGARNTILGLSRRRVPIEKEYAHAD